MELICKRLYSGSGSFNKFTIVFEANEWLLHRELSRTGRVLKLSPRLYSGNL